MTFQRRILDRITGSNAHKTFYRTALGLSQIFIYTHIFNSYFYSISPTTGISMYPTIPNDDSGTRPWVIGSRLHRRGRNVRVGDIVTVTHPLYPKGHMAKRIIGMPGDYVSVFTPGRETSEDVAVADGERPWTEVKEQMLRVPEGHCWLMGDNLDYSRDSRTFGAIPLAMVEDKVIGVMWFWGFRWIGSQDQLQDAPRT